VAAGWLVIVTGGVKWIIQKNQGFFPWTTGAAVISPNFKTSTWFGVSTARSIAARIPSIPAGRSISVLSENADAWNNLGVDYEIPGQTAKVMEVYKRLKILDPNPGACRIMPFFPISSLNSKKLSSEY
jgi:hypothetical protein